jgi:chromosome segregation ATPase
MAETIKFTKEEMDRIQDLRNQGSKLMLELGQAEAELFLARRRVDQIKDAKEQLTNRYITLQNAEQELVKDLNSKYGAGSVDVESGEFIPAQ